MIQKKYYTKFEIQSQHDAWAEAIQVTSDLVGQLRQLWTAGEYDQVIFTGCGSTYYLSMAAAAFFNNFNRIVARAIPAGELLLYPELAYSADRKTFFVAISRSGTTTETNKALEYFKNHYPSNSVVITNYPDAPLVKLGDLSICIPEGQEQSVAQTRSFASMYIASIALGAIFSAREDLLEEMSRLPDVGYRLLANYDALAYEIGTNLDLDRFYFLGGGARYGLACETNLKMKEMTLTHSEPFHFLEFRHGPMSMITNTAAVIGMLSDFNYTHENLVIEEMQRLDAMTLSIGESNTDVAFKSQLSEEIRGVLYLPVLQLMAYYRSEAKGLDPDKPKNLTSVVELDI